MALCINWWKAKTYPAFAFSRIDQVDHTLPWCISVLMMINIPSRCQVQDKPFPHNSQDEKRQMLIMSQCLWFLLLISGNKEMELAENKWVLELFHVWCEWGVISWGGGPYMWGEKILERICENKFFIRHIYRGIVE